MSHVSRDTSEGGRRMSVHESVTGVDGRPHDDPGPPVPGDEPTPPRLIADPSSTPPRFQVIAVGDVRIDLTADLEARFGDLDHDHQERTAVRTSLAGTAMAFAAAGIRHFSEVGLVAALGRDVWEAEILAECRARGIHPHFETTESPTGYALLLRDHPRPSDPRGVRLLVSQAPSASDSLDPGMVEHQRGHIAAADALFLDGYGLLAESPLAATDLAQRIALESGTVVTFDVVPHHIDELLTLGDLVPFLERSDLVTVEAPTLARLVGRRPPRVVTPDVVTTLVDAASRTLRPRARTWFVRFGEGQMEDTVVVGPGGVPTHYRTGYSGVSDPTGFGHLVSAAELKWWLLRHRPRRSPTSGAVPYGWFG